MLNSTSTRFTKLKLIFTMTGFLLFGCSVSNKNEQQSSLNTIGGDIDYAAYPEIVYLFSNKVGNEGDLCMGILLRPFLVMTAAHCLIADIDSLTEKPKEDIEVVYDDIWVKRRMNALGVMDPSFGLTFLGIGTKEKFFIHPEFIDAVIGRNTEGPKRESQFRDNSIAVDIGFIELIEWEYDDSMNTYASLSTEGPSVGDQVFLAGKSFAETYPSGNVRYMCCSFQTVGKNKIAGFEYEKNIITLEGAISDEAYEQDPSLGVSATVGESGGPLFSKTGEVLGILSSGFVEGDVNTNYYVNINGKSREYIDSFLKEYDEREQQSRKK